MLRLAQRINYSVMTTNFYLFACLTFDLFTIYTNHCLRTQLIKVMVLILIQLILFYFDLGITNKEVRLFNLFKPQLSSSADS